MGASHSLRSTPLAALDAGGDIGDSSNSPSHKCPSRGRSIPYLSTFVEQMGWGGVHEGKGAQEIAGRPS